MYNLLTYYVSFNGTEQYSETSKSIETLIKVGNYKGDIIVLTDVDSFYIDVPEEYYKNIKFIKCLDDIKNDVSMFSGKFAVRYFRNIKGYIAKFCDIEEYDCVMYLDSDVLVNKDVNEIYENTIKYDIITVQKDVGNVDKTKIVDGKIEGPTIGGDVLNEEMINYLHGNGFCTGVLCFSKNNYEFIRKWHEKNIEEKFEKSDQGNFHWVVANNKILHKIKYIKAYPFNEYKDELIFQHYWCGEKKKFYEQYDSLINKKNNCIIKDCKSYVINLENDKQSLQNFSLEANKINIDYTVFTAKKFKTSPINISVKQYGCRDSHLKIMSYNTNSDKNLLIMEDDCCFVKDHDILLKKINEEYNQLTKNDWDIIFFYNTLKQKIKEDFNGILHPGRTDLTHFYVINSISIKKIHDLVNDIENKPIDWAFRQLIVEKKIKGYVCAKDFAFQQRNKNSKFLGKFLPCNCDDSKCTCGGGLHSYEDKFIKIINILKPKSCLEWGPGKNTSICLDTGMHVHSKEYSQEWLFKDADKYEKYSFELIDFESEEWERINNPYLWDIFFVDSRKRQECIKEIFNNSREDSVLFLHDAQRKRYHEALSLFPHIYFVERGFCFATKSNDVFKYILKELSII